MDNETRVRHYLQAIERGAGPKELAEFLHPDVIMQEFPNRLVPNGGTRNLAAMQEASVRGQKSVGSQRYEVLFCIAQGDSVAMEVNWSAELKVALGSIPVGGTMRARFGMFLTLRDGQIISQRNYDCFEPF